MKKTLFKKEFIITMIVAVICLVLIGVFPYEDSFQGIIIAASFFLIVPWIYTKIVLKESMKKYGFEGGKEKSGIFWSSFSLAIFLLITILAYKKPIFIENYQLPGGIFENFWAFVGYEIFLVGFFLFLYEFFFHGWLLGFLEKYFGVISVFIQSLIFLIFLFLTDNLNWSFFPYIMINIFGGWTTYKSNSIWFSFVSGWIFIIFLDAFFIRLL
jgi:membrane protease YdiL (CAAX protease family)